MTTTPPIEILPDTGQIGKSAAPVFHQSPFARLARLLPRRLSARIGLIVILGVIVVAVFAPELAPYPPLKQNLAHALRPPLSSSKGQLHLLGTDSLGRDLLSRMMVGIRPVLEVVAMACALAGGFGFLYGLVAAFVPRVLQELMLRIADIQLSIPPFILAILLAVLISPGIKSSAISIAVVTWPAYARLIRTDAAKLKSSHFVLSARVAGLSWPRILYRHVAKNVLTVFVVLLTFNIGVTIIFESSLSFIGYGVQPPQPDLGNILADGVQHLNQWWLAMMPGIAIIVLVLASNALGEEIRARVDDPGGALSDFELTPLGITSSSGLASWRAKRGRTTSTIGDLDDRAGIDDPAPNNNVAAAVEHLSVAAVGKGGDRPIVQDISLSIPKGELFAIVGESGSGKSTLCLALLGMIPAGLKQVGGRVQVLDHDIVEATEDDLRKIRGRLVGVVFQDPMLSLNPVRKVGWQVVEARRIHELDSAPEREVWARDTMTMLGFADPARVERSYPHQLSGGMRQRACIGVAVSADPELLLADEPTTALDMSVRGQVLRGILSYCAEGRATLVIVSHDINVVRAVSTRVAVMLGGRVLEEGPTDEVLERPKSPYTRGLLQASVMLTPELRGQPLPTLSEEGGGPVSAEGCPFASRCPNVVDRCHAEFPEPVVWRATGRERRAWCWNPIA